MVWLDYVLIRWGFDLDMEKDYWLVVVMYQLYDYDDVMVLCRFLDLFVDCFSVFKMFELIEFFGVLMDCYCGCCVFYCFVDCGFVLFVFKDCLGYFIVLNVGVVVELLVWFLFNLCYLCFDVFVFQLYFIVCVVCLVLVGVDGQFVELGVVDLVVLDVELCVDLLVVWVQVVVVDDVVLILFLM